MGKSKRPTRAQINRLRKRQGLEPLPAPPRYGRPLEESRKLLAVNVQQYVLKLELGRITPEQLAANCIEAVQRCLKYERSAEHLERWQQFAQKGKETPRDR